MEALTMHRLLVVDDDSDIRGLLAEQLGRTGYTVSTARDGAEMRHALAREHIDLIVLDLNLPREDGLALCRELRARSSTPVIMLTARSEPIDRVLGLEMGADDYLAKPFEPRELLARIRNVLRRTEALPANLEPLAMRRAAFSGWLFDLERRHLVDPAGRVVMLSGAEFRLLRVFVGHANKVLSREQLVALSSGRSYEAQDRAIDLQVSRLRQKLGDAGGLIRTVRNEGYVFAGVVTLG
ncbi:MAG: response regulator [Stenotrophomonas nitritireducens]|uniref:Transcriptional regulator n=2 Tax=Lysobacteraceae TaxID=32033 RepID=A0ABR5NIJ8_9GAMM|nr:two-component system response regulator [Stenotrophomonas sp. Leaf70]KRG56259.1 transcriptional regulator [Stenotrophomonas nitritireducens]MBN8790872.1 response regulator [Stenotrophomonas nitritireducens]MBN8796737.1 response regulator [Stenotrophomonas nitritireducens]